MFIYHVVEDEGQLHLCSPVESQEDIPAINTSIYIHIYLSNYFYLSISIVSFTLVVPSNPQNTFPRLGCVHIYIYTSIYIYIYIYIYLSISIYLSIYIRIML